MRRIAGERDGQRPTDEVAVDAGGDRLGIADDQLRLVGERDDRRLARADAVAADAGASVGVVEVVGFGRVGDGDRDGRRGRDLRAGDVAASAVGVRAAVGDGVVNLESLQRK